MGTWRVELSDGRAFDVEADAQPGEADILAALGEGAPAAPAAPAAPPPGDWIGKELGAPAPSGFEAIPPEEMATLGERAREAVAVGAETALPAAGAIGGGILAGPPGAVAGGATAGYAGSVVADLIRGEPLSQRKALANAAISAIPGGAAEALLAKTAARGVAKRAAAHAAEGAVIGGGSTVARSLIEEGELPTVGEVGRGVGIGAATGGALSFLSGTKPPTLAETRARLDEAIETATAREAAGELPASEWAARLEKPLPEVQYEVFDDAGHVRPNVREWSDIETITPTARAYRQMTEAVLAEGRQAADLLARTEAAQAGKRINRQIAEYLEKRAESGDLDVPGFLGDLERSGLSMPEWIRESLPSGATRSARILNYLSQVKKQIQARNDPGMQEALSILRAANGGSNRLLDFLNKLNDTRRAMLITQIKTGVRNFYNQGGAATIDVIEAGLADGTAGMRNTIESLVMAAHKSKIAPEIDRLFQTRPDLRSRLGTMEYDAPELLKDVPLMRATIGKLTEWTTAINRWQEMFYRSAMARSSILRQLRRGGHSADLINNPAELDRLGILDNALDDALNVTFAAPRPGGVNTALTGIPKLLITGIAPFPRYMANAATYVAKRNPLGLVRLMTQHGRANANKVLAEAATGTMLLGGALALRYGEHAKDGEGRPLKWYEVNMTPGGTNKVIDTRGVLGPFAPYAFFGEALRQYSENGRVNFSNSDLVEATLSMNRVSGTLMTAVSWLKGDAGDTAGWNKQLSRLSGDWFAGFSVPAKNVQDALTIAGREESGTWRDVREQPFAGPTMANIPFVSETLPESVKLTTGGPSRVEHPIAFGVFGINPKSSDDVERAMAEINLGVTEVAPKTGVPKIDRELYRRVGKVVSAIGPKLVNSAGYKALTPAQKTLALKSVFKAANKAARENLAATNPRLAAVLKVKDRLTGDQRALMRERGVDIDAALRKLVDEAPEGGNFVTEPAEIVEPTSASPAENEPQAAAPVDDSDPMSVAAQLTGIDPTLLEAVVAQESSGDPNAIGPVTPYTQGETNRARGLMQLTPPTFEGVRPEVEALIGREATIHDPLSNLVAGSLLYQRYLEQEGGDLAAAARLYYGGENKDYHGPKTAKYGRDIVRRFAALRRAT